MADLSSFSVLSFPDNPNLRIVAGVASFSDVVVLYPAGSINPGNEVRPHGGVQNVTLNFSAFFSVDFDWVLAGKLSGLYGVSAANSFSTRLMWRKDGKGELYLTKNLCDDPQSVCTTVYGFSIGRGSFFRKTVVLNTTGLTDGCFNARSHSSAAMKTRYTTPKDQYTWFKDLAMCLNE
ncbi:uncharacterized protein BT62DRAFT_977569 [Guyanagaster necrorhizus]|uniref:Polysaccharide lyase 14 domain-containing protein n=1 Tax=Guyanagaster necrorhizus TaxID=856835 RepID=A0A9P7W5M2_9AGAR|nr:uncharacterized protein BT62DRAFT_977569 [Guyanagaster necrorhizus MCA 3950]KAG7453103.1 hypothetical protein BT62DRAFT_977569 [Guyanagaster necrorhizus MCA 3950]